MCRHTMSVCDNSLITCKHPGARNPFLQRGILHLGLRPFPRVRKQLLPALHKLRFILDRRIGQLLGTQQSGNFPSISRPKSRPTHTGATRFVDLAQGRIGNTRIRIAWHCISKRLEVQNPSHPLSNSIDGLGNVKLLLGTSNDVDRA